ncbi:MAG: T9SS type A sorting domain-containing protein, partial [bacterium]
PIAVKHDGLFTVRGVIPRVVVSIPDTSAKQGMNIKIPIRVGELTGLDVTSIRLSLSFDGSVLDATNASNEGTVASVWEPPQFTDGVDTIDIELSGYPPLSGKGDLVYLNFDVNGEPGDSTVINFISFTFNNGDPIAIINDGSLYVNGIIPVELVLFEGISLGKKVTLSWTTASETNNYGFEVQRSSSKHQNDEDWQTIGFVAGKGTTSLTHSYLFYDQNVENETYYYRLKQIDHNGTFSYSMVIEITINNPQYVLLKQNYPNPFNSRTVINYQIPENDYVELKIYNLLGEEICLLVNKHQPPGFYSVEWNGQNNQEKSVPSGVYIYRLKVGDSTRFKKMIMLE